MRVPLLIIAVIAGIALLHHGKRQAVVKPAVVIWAPSALEVAAAKLVLRSSWDSRALRGWAVDVQLRHAFSSGPQFHFDDGKVRLELDTSIEIPLSPSHHLLEGALRLDNLEGEANSDADEGR